MRDFVEVACIVAGLVVIVWGFYEGVNQAKARREVAKQATAAAKKASERVEASVKGGAADLGRATRRDGRWPSPSGSNDRPRRPS